MEPDDFVLTVNELADMMKLHPFTVARLARQGKIPGAFKMGGVWRVPTAKLKEWIAAGGDHALDRRNGPRRR